LSILIRPFRASDLAAFTPIEALKLAEIKDPELAKAIEDSGLAVTGIRNGVIVGCGGVHPVDDFHGEIWLRLSKTCQKYPLGTLRWLKSGLDIIEKTYPFKQLNATIKCGFDKSIKLIEYLGFGATELKDGWMIFSKRIQE